MGYKMNEKVYILLLSYLYMFSFLALTLAIGVEAMTKANPWIY
jgi:hypothetical protein